MTSGRLIAARPLWNSDKSMEVHVPRYDRVSMLVHWLLAALIGITFISGVYMVDLSFSPLRLRLFNWHKWAGIAVLALSAARLFWRFVGQRSPPLPEMPAWQLAVHRGIHLMFFALFFVVPLVGWMYTSAIGFPVVWLGWIALPDLISLNKAFGVEVLRPLHSAAAYVLAALVAFHVFAALKHQFLDGDHLISRMWPR